ncbi:site-specific integrase [Mycolicibacterium thermoresistibile]
MAGRPPLAIGTYGKIRRTRLENGSWLAEARYRDRDGVTRKVKATGSTGAKAEAELREKLKIRRQAGGTDTLTPESTVADLMRRWLVEVDGSGRTQQTKDYYRRAVEQLVIPGVGNLRIRELDPQRVDGFLRALPVRARDARTTLRQASSMAVRFGLLEHNPVNDTYSPPRKRGKPRSLSPDDVEVLLGRIRTWQEAQSYGPKRGYDLYEIFSLLLATGARIGELLALRWEDVENLDDDMGAPCTVTFAGTLVSTGKRQDWTKTETGYRTVTLPAFGRQALITQRARELPFELVFPNRNGDPRSVSNVRLHWRHIRGEDYAWVTPHSFRRTVATMVEREYGIEFAAKHLGHSDPEVTRRHYVERAAQVPDVSGALATFADRLGKPARHLRSISAP